MNYIACLTNGLLFQYSARRVLSKQGHIISILLQCIVHSR